MTCTGTGAEQLWGNPFAVMLKPSTKSNKVLTNQNNLKPATELHEQVIVNRKETCLLVSVDTALYDDDDECIHLKQTETKP
jgi:hypothetical protein